MKATAQRKVQALEADVERLDAALMKERKGLKREEIMRKRSVCFEKIGDVKDAVAEVIDTFRCGQGMMPDGSLLMPDGSYFHGS